MKCMKCGQEAPEGAQYCPNCTGRQTPDRAVLRGGLVGALKGLFLGLLPSIWLFVQLGAEGRILAMAIALPIVTLTAGLIIGLIKAKRESK